MRNLFRTGGLAALVESLDLVMVDLGARGGLDEDLHPVAWATRAIGFEADAVACEELNRVSPGPWRSVRFLPVALGGREESRTLFIPLNPVGASLLEHNSSLVDRFGHRELHEVSRTVEVRTVTLDAALAEDSTAHADYLKIDVEGAELEILESGRNVLERCSAVKVECSFLEQRMQQPLIWEVCDHLRRRGFAIVDLRDMHYWRRRPKPAHPFMARSGFPYSRGIVAQCDVLALRESFDPGDVDLGLRAVLVASALGYFDYALTLVHNWRSLHDELGGRAGSRWEGDLAAIARRIGRIAAGRELKRRVRSLVPVVRSAIRGLPDRNSSTN